MTFPQNNSFSEIWDELMRAERILIPLHLGPDTDCIGSAVAMGLVLQNIGKEVIITSEDELPDIPSLVKLFPVKNISLNEMKFKEFDLLLLLDVSGANRTTEATDLSFIQEIETVLIDHHLFDGYVADINYRDTQAVSASEIVYQLFKSNNTKITKDVAEALMYGLLADSGWFSYEASATSFTMAAELIVFGINTRKIKYELSTLTLNQFYFKGITLSRIEFVNEGNFAFTYITYAELVNLGYLEESELFSTRLIVDQFKYLNKPMINFGALAKESDPGVYKVSLRTREALDFNVAEIANVYGGGGHSMAAGIKVEADNPEQVKQMIIDAVKRVGKTELVKRE